MQVSAGLERFGEVWRGLEGFGGVCTCSTFSSSSELSDEILMMSSANEAISENITDQSTKFDCFSELIILPYV